MVEILRKMFKAHPEKSTIVLIDNCSDCGCEAIIEITPTSCGFGLQGGALFKCPPNGYLAKCPNCYKESQKIDDNQKSGKKRIKILLVEDEITSRKLLNSFLLPLGDVDIAVNGNEAIAAVKKALENNQPYELIFLDIMLPEFDGITTLKNIRELEAQQELNKDIKSKVIMISARSEKEIVLESAQADCTGYLIKPIDKIRLYDEIRKHGFYIPK
jgi:two-component system chemotaxis response regulator CheY